MNRGFFIILGSQFLSALADNALFAASLALLKNQCAPEWHNSMLLMGFTVFYVVLAPFAGSFADSMHKGNAMMLCNGIKLLGCASMLFNVPPIIGYSIVGLGAAAYSPAKYGIVTEYLPHDQLVKANGWLEGATVCSIIFGTVLGGFLSGQYVDGILDLYPIGNFVSAPEFAIAGIAVIYLLAALLNLHIPKLNVHLKPMHISPTFLIKEFWWCHKRLWRDPQGGLSMAVTTLFWGTGATMRLVVINWAIIWLALTQEQSMYLVAIVAVGIATGATLAGIFVPLKKSFSVLPAGIIMGVATLLMLFIHNIWMAWTLMLIIGVLSGFFVVPLNAMLQHRGHHLMGAGHSIAVQNFNENIGILVMLGLHALIVAFITVPVPSSINAIARAHFQNTNGMPPMYLIIIGLGILVIVAMSLIMALHRHKGKTTPDSAS